MAHERAAAAGALRWEHHVIFATCGAAGGEIPFHRMMEALSVLPADELYVQHGRATPPPCARADAFLPFGRIVELMEEAEVVVCHGGVGSIMCALRAGHVPVTFPRLKRYAEIADDHQVELAEALAARGTVTIARTGPELLEAVASSRLRTPATMLDANHLAAAVRSAVHGELRSSWRKMSAVG
jgi:UDP-N-acetylglucosamine transferase subunit ALG13